MRPLLPLRLVPLLLACAAVPAGAQQPPPPDPLEGATVRFGPVGLSPTIVVRDIGRDSNVFNEPVNPREDFTMTVSPKLDVLVHPGPLSLTYTTTTDYVYYQTYKSERGTNVGMSVRGEVQIGAFRPYASFGRGNTRERLNREIDERARHHERSYGAGVRVQLFEGVFATAGLRRQATDYDANAAFRGQKLETTLDSQTDTFEGGAGVALTPLTSLQVIVSKERMRFDFSRERDSETWRIAPTVSFSPLAILSGTAMFGYRHFTTDSPLVPDYSGFVSTVTLGTTVLERHHLQTTFSRDLQYSYEADTPEYLETGVLVSWAVQIVGPLDTRLTAGRSRLHYRAPNLTSERDDDTSINYGFSLGYRIKDNLRAGLNGDWRERQSERSADRTFENRKIYATLTWGKQ